MESRNSQEKSSTNYLDYAFGEAFRKAALELREALDKIKPEDMSPIDYDAVKLESKDCKRIKNVLTCLYPQDEIIASVVKNNVTENRNLSFAVGNKIFVFVEKHFSDGCELRLRTRPAIAYGDYHSADLSMAYRAIVKKYRKVFNRNIQVLEPTLRFLITQMNVADEKILEFYKKHFENKSPLKSEIIQKINKHLWLTSYNYRFSLEGDECYFKSDNLYFPETTPKKIVAICQDALVTAYQLICHSESQENTTPKSTQPLDTSSLFCVKNSLPEQDCTQSNESKKHEGPVL